MPDAALRASGADRPERGARGGPRGEMRTGTPPKGVPLCSPPRVFKKHTEAAMQRLQEEDERAPDALLDGPDGRSPELKETGTEVQAQSSPHCTDVQGDSETRPIPDARRARHVPVCALQVSTEACSPGPLSTAAQLTDRWVEAAGGGHPTSCKTGSHRPRAAGVGARGTLVPVSHRSCDAQSPSPPCCPPAEGRIEARGPCTKAHHGSLPCTALPANVTQDTGLKP